MIITNFEQLKDFRKVPGNYKFRNKTNNWHYCGQTNNLYRRIVIEHKNAVGKYYIDYFIKNHGLLETFEIELIDYGEHLKDKITRISLETACIIEYNSLKENGHGYNICLIGDNTNGHNLSKETKEKISKANKGRKRSLESRIKQSKSIKGENSCRFGKKSHFLGKQHTKETLEKILNTKKERGVSYKGENNPKFDHTIYHFKNTKTNEEFIGYRYDFIKKYNLNNGNVMSLIKNNYKSTNKWILIK